MKIFILLLMIFSLNANAEKIQYLSLPVYKQDNKFSQLEKLKGKKVLINFWATWCTSCIQELPELESLKEKYGDRVEFVAVNAGEKSNLIDKFFRKYKFSYVQLLDEERKFSKSLKIESLPHTLVIDENQNIIYRDVRPPKEL